VTDSDDYADAVTRRRSRAADLPRTAPPTIAVLSDRPDAPLLGLLTSAGWSVTGVLAADVFDGLLWASQTPGVDRNYLDLGELLSDPSLDACCLAVPPAGLGSVLVATLQAGLHTLLPRPAELGADTVRRALAAAEDSGAEHAVAMQQRWRAPVARVARALDSGELGPPAQLTVRGWPTGAVPTAELLDVVTRWCGDVVAVCATPDQLPARELPGGATVRWALLTASGATVLVAHDGAGVPLMRLSCPQGRVEVEAGPGDGTVHGPLGTLAPPDDATMLPTDGLRSTATRLAEAVTRSEAVASPYDGWPWPSTLRDLFVVERIREALRSSAAERRWVETG
jgi:predicted dehydrogenase